MTSLGTLEEALLFRGVLEARSNFKTFDLKNSIGFHLSEIENFDINSEFDSNVSRYPKTSIYIYNKSSSCSILWL